MPTLPDAQPSERQQRLRLVRTIAVRARDLERRGEVDLGADLVVVLEAARGLIEQVLPGPVHVAIIVRPRGERVNVGSPSASFAHARV